MSYIDSLDKDLSEKVPGFKILQYVHHALPHLILNNK